MKLSEAIGGRQVGQHWTINRFIDMQIGHNLFDHRKRNKSETQIKPLNRERSVLFVCEVQKKESEEDIEWKQTGRNVCLQEQERRIYVCECFLKGDQIKFSAAVNNGQQ
jgi:hypothetical protein